jgi:hypothetical protein
MSGPRVPPTRGRRLLAAGALLAGGSAAAFLYLVDPAASSAYPRCALREIAGLECPGCGSLRAGHAWLHGRVGEAVAWNPLTLVGVPLVLLLGVNEARVALGRPGWRLDPRLGKWAWLVPAGLLLFMLLRNLL